MNSNKKRRLSPPAKPGGGLGKAPTPVPAMLFDLDGALVWDRETWIPENEDVGDALQTGELKFRLNGRRLHGSWVHVRTRGYRHNANGSWLLIKHRDLYASKKDVTSMQARSVASNRLLAEIAGEAGGTSKRRLRAIRKKHRRPRKAHGAVTTLAKVCALKERKRTRGEERGKWNA